VKSVGGRGQHGARFAGIRHGGERLRFNRACVTCEQVGVAIPPAKSKVIAFHLQRFARAWVAGICLVVAVPCMAQAVRPISLDDLRTPSRAAELVSDSQYDAYRDVQRAYAQQETANPNDSALVIAQCQFIESFTDNDDLTWDDDAQTDFQACKKQLEDRFHGDPEASLYVAEHRYGKPVLDFAIPLLPASEHWTVQQRMRLHGVLSGAYTATHQSDLAGQEALTSVRLDPGSAQLTAALRYLCDAGRRSEAESLLAKAPLPTSAWIEEQRVRFAADSLSPATALAELQRADSAGQKTDPWIAARIYLRAGMNAKAADALSKVKIKPAYQTVAQYQLRVDVAAVQKDGNAASAAFHDWFSKTGITAPLLSAYGMLLAHDPLQLFAPTLAPFALAMFAMLVFLACLPGVIAFPAHYRADWSQAHVAGSGCIFGRVDPSSDAGFGKRTAIARSKPSAFSWRRSHGACDSVSDAGGWCAVSDSCGTASFVAGMAGRPWLEGGIDHGGGVVAFEGTRCMGGHAYGASRRNASRHAA
jgi:hypothetical protein